VKLVCSKKELVGRRLNRESSEERTELGRGGREDDPANGVGSVELGIKVSKEFMCEYCMERS